MRKSLFLFFMLFILFVNGCMSSAPYRYDPSEKITKAEPLPLTAAIELLKDGRDTINADYTLIGWIPLVPYGTARFSRPEESFKFSFKRFKPREDFAKALYEEIKQNNLFQNVILVQKPDSKPDLIVTGKISTARVDTTITFYGLSFLGELPWLLGLPMGKVYNTLDIHYEMRRSSDNTIVWEYNVQGNWNMFIGAYYNSHKDEPYTGMNLILREGLKKGIETLHQEIQSRPLTYWK